jgi:hypothetical protein
LPKVKTEFVFINGDTEFVPIIDRKTFHLLIAQSGFSVILNFEKFDVTDSQLKRIVFLFINILEHDPNGSSIKHHEIDRKLAFIAIFLPQVDTVDLLLLITLLYNDVRAVVAVALVFPGFLFRVLHPKRIDGSVKLFLIPIALWLLLIYISLSNR